MNNPLDKPEYIERVIGRAAANVCNYLQIPAKGAAFDQISVEVREAIRRADEYRAPDYTEEQVRKWTTLP